MRKHNHTITDAAFDGVGRAQDGRGYFASASGGGRPERVYSSPTAVFTQFGEEVIMASAAVDPDNLGKDTDWNLEGGL